MDFSSTYSSPSSDFDSTQVLGREQAQNTAQRGKAVSDKMQEAYSNVSDGKMKGLTSASIDPDTGINTDTGEVGRTIPSGSASSVGIERSSISPHELEAERDYVAQHRNKKAIEDAAMALSEKDGIPYTQAYRLATGALNVHLQSIETKFKKNQADIAQQNKELVAQGALSDLQLDLAAVDPSDPNAIKNYHQAMVKHAKNLVGTSSFEKGNELFSGYLNHADKYSRTSLAYAKNLDIENKNKELQSQKDLVQSQYQDLAGVQTIEDLNQLRSRPDWNAAKTARGGFRLEQEAKVLENNLKGSIAEEQAKNDPNAEPYYYMAGGIQRKGYRLKKQTGLDILKEAQEFKKTGTTGATIPLVAPAPTSIGSTKPASSRLTPEEQEYNADSSSLPESQSQDTTGQSSGISTAPQFVEGKIYRNKGGSTAYRYTNGQFIPVQ